MKLVVRLWRDERGEVGAASVVLIYAILVLGAIVGLTFLRNAIVQEFGDLSLALRHLNQSFSFSDGVTIHSYNDLQIPTASDDPPGAPPAGIQFVAPSPGNAAPGED